MTSARRAGSAPTLALAACCAAALCASSAGTRADDGVRARRESAVFWQRVTQPDAARAAALLEAARGWLDVLTQTPSGDWSALCPTLDGSSARLLRERLVKRAVASENAIARLELARSLTPDDLEVAYALARAMGLWERPEHGCAMSRRDAETLALWQRVRALDPTFEPESVGSELALAQTRLGDVDAALSEYEALVELTAHAPRAAQLAHGNLAELLMMKGEALEAVTHYEEAARLARELDDGGALALAEFGLAAALDRLGERAQALTVARAAVDRSDDSLRALRNDSVFFVPAYEVHFYEALGQESRADGTRAPLPAAHARGSRAESLASAVERALASALAPTDLDALGRALAAWLRASAAAPSVEASAVELSSGRALAELTERVRAATEARLLRAQTADSATTLRTIAGSLADAPLPEARARLRLGCLAAAARSWRRYLDEGGRDGRFAEHARAHLAALADAIAPSDGARAAHPTRRRTP